MLSFRDYLKANKVSQTAMAERLSQRLGRSVPLQSVNRWAQPFGHKHFCVPPADMVLAICEETGGEVEPNDWYQRPAAGEERAA